MEQSIFILVGLILIFLLCREIMCWYWKIGEIIGLLQRSLEEMKITNSILRNANSNMEKWDKNE
jgi:hypothetical protein